MARTRRLRIADVPQASASAARRPAPKATSAICRTAASCVLMLGQRQREADLGEQRRVGLRTGTATYSMSVSSVAL